MEVAQAGPFASSCELRRDLSRDTFTLLFRCFFLTQKVTFLSWGRNLEPQKESNYFNPSPMGEGKEAVKMRERKL